MKINHELIRLLMLKMRDNPKLNGQNRVIYQPTVDGYSSEDINYQLRLIDDAGFLLNTDRMGTGTLITSGLSWTGQGFIDSIASDTVWAQVKNRVAKTTGEVSLSVLSDLAIQIAKQLFGLAP